MHWNMAKKQNPRMNFDTAATNTVQSDGLTATERFVREVISNSRDSKLDNDQPVKVTFRLIDLEGEKKQHFCEKAGLPELANAYKSIADYSDETLKKIFLGVHPDSIKKTSTPLRTLCITDSNTKGLIGPELFTPDIRNKKDLRFLGLCKSVGLNSGSNINNQSGSWGYGKSVLWANNHTRSVLFYSKLSNPWTENSTEVNERLTGFTMLPDFFLEGSDGYDGEIMFGNKKGDINVYSVWNHDAKQFAEDLNVEGFQATEPGTSQLIIGYQPSDLENNTSTETVAEQIKEAVEKFFWPAIDDNRLAVEIFINGNLVPINILENTSVQPFVRLYRKMKTSTLQPEQYSVISLDLRGGSLNDGKVLIGAKVLPEGLTGCNLINHIAKIRGNQMVIEYKESTHSTLSGSGGVGVALAGAIVPEDYGTIQDQQIQLDELLLASEPIAHHKWDEKETKIKDLRASSAIIKLNRDILHGFRDLIRNRKEEYIGEYSTLLSRLIKLGGNEGPGVRGGDVEYQTLINMNKSVAGEQCRFGHKIRYRLKPKNNWKRINGRQIPTNVRLTPRFRAIDESGQRIKIEDELKFTISEITEIDLGDDPETVSPTSKTRKGSPSETTIQTELDNNYHDIEVSWLSNLVSLDFADAARLECTYSWEKGR